ncbi:hypothetical protein JHK82_055692 [Glycine max]|nr:hypothetical protein JHK82_055692 [Glycine max]
MGDLCSKSVKADKVFAKSDGHSDKHKSDGKNYKSTNMPSDLTSAGDHGLDKKKQEAATATGNGSNDFYDGIPWFNDSFTHKSRSVKSRHVVAKASIFETLGVTSLSGKFSPVPAFEEGSESSYLDKKDLDTCGPKSESKSHPMNKMKSSKDITPYCAIFRTQERNGFPVSLDNKNSLDQLKQYDVIDNCSDHHFFHEGEKIDIISCKKLAKYH